MSEACSPHERNDMRGLRALHAPAPDIALMSFVKRLAQESSSPCECRRRVAVDDRARVGAKPEDVGDQALMRGSTPQFRISSGAVLCLRTGIDRSDRPHSDIGSSPAVALPPPLHDVCDRLAARMPPPCCWYGGRHIAGAAGLPTARPTAHTKPASSRAMAVITVWTGLPDAISRR